MRERIESAVKLILQNSGDDWFMILEESESEKFVQFAFDEDSGLVFDLPLQALTPEEIELSRTLLASYGIGSETAQVFDGPDGDEVGEQCSFQTVVGFDTELAVTLTYRIFREVYGFTDATRFDVTIMR